MVYSFTSGDHRLFYILLFGHFCSKYEYFIFFAGLNCVMDIGFKWMENSRWLRKVFFIELRSLYRLNVQY